MFSRLQKVIPGLSAAALIVLTLFNVGYFSRIGLHFLGLIDVSNLVYSFALSIIALFCLMFIVGWNTFDFFDPKRTNFQRAFKITLVIKSIAVLLFLAWFIAVLSNRMSASSDVVIALVFLAVSIAFGLHGYARKMAHGAAYPSDYILSIFVACLCVMSTGRAVAFAQMTSGPTDVAPNFYPA
jgi:hypothetical protein